jgi:hypothetical protein
MQLAAAGRGPGHAMDNDPMTEEPMTYQRRISRRTVVKGAGLGAAAVWVAPAVTSLAGNAHAAGSAVCTTCGSFCDSPPQCANNCECLTDVSGACFCGFPFACFSDGQDPICQTDADCVEQFFPGARCINVVCADPACIGNTACAADCSDIRSAKVRAVSGPNLTRLDSRR